MRNFRKLMQMAAFCVGFVLFCAGRSNAQVIGTTGIDPFTGQIISTSSGFNPLLNQFGSSRVVINPLTGQQTAVGISQNPLTGTISRTDIVRNPFSGATFSVQQRYNPLLNRYRVQTNFRR